MKQYILRRFALAIPTLFIVSVIVFGLMRLMPGDVATRMVEGHGYASTLDALRHDLGLDRPVHVQYLEWIGNIVLHGDFGRSYWTRQPILEEFVRRFPVTLELALLTILVSVVIGVIVGILSAVRQDSVSDYVGRILAILALSIPYFGLAVVVVVVPSIYFKWTPVWTYVAFTADPLQNLKIMLVPALVFGVTRAGPRTRASTRRGGRRRPRAPSGRAMHRATRPVRVARASRGAAQARRLPPATRCARPAPAFGLRARLPRGWRRGRRERLGPDARSSPAMRSASRAHCASPS